MRIAAADIGTGARTALTQIAADALEVPLERVAVEVGDSGFPRASVAGGSSGTASWGTAVVLASRALREQLDEHGGEVPAGRPRGDRRHAATSSKSREQLARYAFGAQFADVRVDAATGEVRVSRMLGVFAAGRIINPRTARSQLIGGMTMGISMALHEESVMDAAYGDFVNKDFAQYHVAACADIEQIEAHWIDETDDELNPMGSKGIGEIGIVGTAAAVAQRGLQRDRAPRPRPADPAGPGARRLSYGWPHCGAPPLGLASARATHRLLTDRRRDHRARSRRLGARARGVRGRARGRGDRRGVGGAGLGGVVAVRRGADAARPRGGVPRLPRRG